MELLTEAFEPAFMQRALVGSLVAVVATSLVGTWVVLRGLAREELAEQQRVQSLPPVHGEADIPFEVDQAPDRNLDLVPEPD